MKNTTFEEPFIGYDHFVKPNGLKYSAVIGRFGNPVLAIEIKNTVEQFSADPQSYQQYHNVLQNIISIIGEGYVVQKLDVFSKKKYEDKHQYDEYLHQSYADHFNGRVFKTIRTVFSFSEIVNSAKKGGKAYTYTEKKYKEIRDKVEKVYLLLDQYGFKPKFLQEQDFEFFLGSHYTMSYDSVVKKFDNIASYPTHLRIGKQHIKSIVYVDVEDIEIPNEISPYSYLGGNTATRNTAVDNFTFINSLNDYNTIVYNQIISIPNQNERAKFLGTKKNRHLGFKTEPINRLCAEEIDLLLDDVAVNSQLIVDAQFALTISCDSLEQLEETQSKIDNQLFQKGIRVSERAYNQLEYFKAGFLGNATELKSDYDMFTTTSEAALCFFFKESYPVSEESNFYLQFSDRQGVPIKVDTSDLPMITGRINNRNKFVLGPSGSGKSFTMNNIVDQYMTQNYDVVIIDTGDSYSGTCAYYNGKNIQYTEENPITMNPFNISKAEFNIEKLEFIVNLIFLIWKGADTAMDTTVKSILDNLVRQYYHQYFEKDKKWYKNKSNQELLLYLSRFNINEEEIAAEFNEAYERNNNYYSLLKIPMNATEEEVKKAYRRMSLILHPDKNTSDPNYSSEMFYTLQDAYATLIDPNKRHAYDQTQLKLSTPKAVFKSSERSKNWQKAYRNAIIAKIRLVEESFAIKELSFNSFYEFSEKYLPLFLHNKRFDIPESIFDLTTFFLVLNDFYRGGIYDRTLNQNADQSLFYEPFIVFEIDNVKDNAKLFPIVTLIIMDTFIQKMRLRKEKRKALIIEEAWKAIASKLMGGYILYLYKTVRKFWGEAIVVTQELDDIIGNAVVKDSIINNSDTFILLDQTKFMDRFDNIANLLSINDVERAKIFTINNLDNKHGRSKFKEFYIKRGAKGEVYGSEVSLQQYLTYTTEKPEKNAVNYYVNQYGNYKDGLEAFINDLKLIKEPLNKFVALINLYSKPIDNRLLQYYKSISNNKSIPDAIKFLENEIKKSKLSLKEIINQKTNQYEKV